MKIAIVGSRDYPAMWRVEAFVKNLAAQDRSMPWRDLLVVSGGADGVDTIAIQTARSEGLNTRVYRPSKDLPPKYAPLARNLTIVKSCDKVVAFWDGSSKGTLDTIKKAVKYGLTVEINP